MEGVGRRINTTNGFLLDIGNHSVNGRENNVLFRNNGDQTFTEVGWVNGVDRIEDGRGIAVLDSDGDGQVDIALRNFHQPAGLLRNRGRAGHWVALQLEGTRSNRDAIGARLRVRTGSRWQTRVVTAGSGYLSSSSLRQHFGLGTASVVDEVVIEWPSGSRTHLQGVPVDRLHTIRESGETRTASPGYEASTSTSTQLTGPSPSPSSSSGRVPDRPDTTLSNSGSAAAM
jgi:hypothetical protein